MAITRDEEVLSGEPRIEGTRIGVRHVSARVIEGGQTPAHVADQLDIRIASVYEALSYYYAHIDEMRDLEAENEAAFDRVRDGSLKPKGLCSDRGSILLDEHVGRVFERLLGERGLRCRTGERPVR